MCRPRNGVDVTFVAALPSFWIEKPLFDGLVEHGDLVAAGLQRGDRLALSVSVELAGRVHAAVQRAEHPGPIGSAAGLAGFVDARRARRDRAAAAVLAAPAAP